MLKFLYFINRLRLSPFNHEKNEGQEIGQLPCTGDIDMFQDLSSTSSRAIPHVSEKNGIQDRTSDRKGSLVFNSRKIYNICKWPILVHPD